jgi:hypothetical protein
MMPATAEAGERPPAVAALKIACQGRHLSTARTARAA